MQRLPIRIASRADLAWPLFATAASRAIETAAIARHPPGTLMERAGAAVARLALVLAPPGSAISVFAGSGHNGGDGLVAARHLHSAGQSVRLWLVADEERLPAEVAVQLRHARDAGVPIHPGVGGEAAANAGLVVDALLGLGLKAGRGLHGPIAAAVAAIRRCSAPVLAVDLPTGLDADTGSVVGEQAVVAQHTLALLTLKPGLFTHQGRDHAGEVWFDDLGEAAAEDSAGARLAPATPWPARRHDSHKGRFGDVAVVGGDVGMTGATVLAASAALAAGAGRVYFSLLAADPEVAQRAELMRRDAWWQSPPAVLRQATTVCGCGGGDAVYAVLPPLLSHAHRLVLDADALNAIAVDPMLRRLLQARGRDGSCTTVLTPHPLEAARLLGVTTAEVQADRVAAARRLAETLGACVVLKGSGSVIASPGSLPFINATGNASLATAGTGDVLAGWLGGAWAQAAETPAVDIARHTVWRHGAAADRWQAARGAGQHGPLRAGELIEALAAGG